MKYSMIIDVGNSQIELAVFNKNGLVDKFRFSTTKFTNEYDNHDLHNFCSKLGIRGEDFEGGMIFSVVPQLSRLIQILIRGELGFDIQIFNPSKYLDKVKTNVDCPEEIGQDLLADIVGAIHEYGCPVVLSDLGTVTKNLIIDKDGVFQGVSFFPGVSLNANVLSDKTAQLPEIGKMSKPPHFYGKNTIDAMTSGIYYCHVASIKRFMQATEDEFGYKFKKIITGGHSKLFENDFKDGFIVDQNLVLKGMYLIYKNQ